MLSGSRIYCVVCAGVSVSGVQRSVVHINPLHIPAAAELRAWYDEHGRGAATTAAGEGLASARKYALSPAAAQLSFVGFGISLLLVGLPRRGIALLEDGHSRFKKPFPLEWANGGCCCCSRVRGE